MSNYVVLIRAKSINSGITTLFVETEIIFMILNAGNEAFSTFFSYAGLFFLFNFGPHPSVLPKISDDVQHFT